MKVTEGVAMGLFHLIKEEITATTSRKLGAALVKPGLKAIAKRFDYSTVGGMPLLGIRGISLVCHGSSKAEAVRKTLLDPISHACPATILRTVPNATLYLDEESFSLSANFDWEWI